MEQMQDILEALRRYGPRAFGQFLTICGIGTALLVGAGQVSRAAKFSRSLTLWVFAGSFLLLSAVILPGVLRAARGVLTEEKARWRNWILSPGVFNYTVLLILVLYFLVATIVATANLLAVFHGSLIWTVLLSVAMLSAVAPLVGRMLLTWARLVLENPGGVRVAWRGTASFSIADRLRASLSLPILIAGALAWGVGLLVSAPVAVLWLVHVEGIAPKETQAPASSMQA